MHGHEIPHAPIVTPVGRGPAYRIHTSRLVLRCWEPSDAALLLAALTANLAHLRPWLPWAQHEPEPLDSKIDRLRQYRGAFDLGQDFIYGLFNPAETQVLGSSGLHTRVGAEAREIGYWVHQDVLNQGLATEAAAALTQVAFTIDQVARVEIHCDPANVRSLAVPRKLGFCHEATLRQRAQTSDGRPRDTMIWTLLAHEYPASPAASAVLEAFDVIGRPLR
ncbi:MAG: GNAT family N-acetyltransferase [Candidatus Tectomicrobia bacterium]|uniref:GNAT family N-acetyltransferase n=1 Tax=Tectimicrobiota bacterium TaxID=2528274 RepID=A0A937W6H6_UNCTE|nr:GNAT family N-acetyltransferase [Candidatus Tectomicrobia bacterium]